DFTLSVSSPRFGTLRRAVLGIMGRILSNDVVVVASHVCITVGPPVAHGFSPHTCRTAGPSAASRTALSHRGLRRSADRRDGRRRSRGPAGTPSSRPGGRRARG